MKDNWKLIKEHKTLRFYQLDFKVKNIFNITKVKTIKELWEKDPIKLLPEYELAEDISEGINKVCISDAHTHIERLVFPAFYVRNKNTGEAQLTYRFNEIDGKHTFRIFGGDSSTVYKDRVYLRHLRSANKGA